MFRRFTAPITASLFSRAMATATTKLTPKVLIPIADGSEDMETAIISDVLVRGGAHVVIAAVGGSGDDVRPIEMARGLRILPTTTIKSARAEQAENPRAFDAIVCPGGMPGAKTLGESDDVAAMIQHAFETEGMLVGAICAAPVQVLGKRGFLRGRKEVSCFPNAKGGLPEGVGFSELLVLEDPDNKLITSQGPGTAIQFALVLVRRLVSQEKAEEVAKTLLVSPRLVMSHV
jgi:4-methyl-5(b-hydroxyethyl)-thiazole monophosphate biosynthesis